MHPDFSKEGKEEKPAGYVGVSCKNLGITAYTLKNCSNPKSKFEKNEGNAYTACKDKQKLEKINKSIRNEISMRDFLSSPCVLL